jgi:peptidyl-tRNA hydrolase
MSGPDTTNMDEQIIDELGMYIFVDAGRTQIAPNSLTVVGCRFLS